MPVPKFIFVRHGEAEHNVAFHEKGEEAFHDKAYEDAPLTQKGLEQATATALALQGYEIGHIWCSPLSRCIQTAEEILEETTAQEIYFHDNLLECQGGGHVCNQRKAKGELKKKFKFENMDYLAELPAFYTKRETLTETAFRMRMLVLFLADLYKNVSEGKYICIVSHETAIFALTGKSLKNAEFVILSLEDCLR